MEGRSMVCENRHTYDVSKRGTVNFLPNQRKTHYDTAQFFARQQVFEAGYYDAMVEALAEVTGHYGKGKPDPVILDAGCGEGFFLRALADRAALPVGTRYLGLDLEKEAISLAGRKHTENAMWMVGDLANVPLPDGSVDVLMNILSPANYGEFSRILAPGGVVVKVVPGTGYLQELREKTDAPYSNEGVLSLFREKLYPLGEQAIHAHLTVDDAMAKAFFHMTPLTQHRREEIAPASIRKITLDLVMLVGRVRIHLPLPDGFLEGIAQLFSKGAPPPLPLPENGRADMPENEPE